MKSTMLFLIVAYCLFSCRKPDQVMHSSLIGKWKLSESLMDPGDGSGKWQPANPANPAWLEFKNNGLLVITPYQQYNSDHYLIYTDSTMILYHNTDTFYIRYRFTSSLLTIYPQCYEACGSKYVPVQ